MAVTVPSEEKIYTTVYDNFKGVDYTDDPSNVWKRRSPDGLNMLPDLDGRPYKRYGWKIEIPAEAFSDTPYEPVVMDEVDVFVDSSDIEAYSCDFFCPNFDDPDLHCNADNHSCPYWAAGENRHMTMREVQDFVLEEMRYTEEEIAQMTQEEKNTISHITIRHYTDKNLITISNSEGSPIGLCPNYSDPDLHCNADNHNCPYWVNDENRHMTPREIQDFEISEMRYDYELVELMTEEEKNRITPWFKINTIVLNTHTIYTLKCEVDGYPVGSRLVWDGTDFHPYIESVVTPERLYHFTLCGFEYIMIFNNLGVFYMRSDRDGVTKCQYKNGNIISDFPPPVDGQTIPADSNRSFYFEGNGIAGFYTFVGNSLFMFDGEYYSAVEPHVPEIIKAADHTGKGDVFEDINLLTEKRMVSYQGDGTNRAYSIPEVPRASSVVVEEYLEVEDEELHANVFKWVTLETPTDYVLDGNVVTFTNPPAAINTDVNVKITYEPSSGGISYNVDSEYVTGEVLITATRKELYTRTKVVKKRKYKKLPSTGIVPGDTEEISQWSSPSVTTTSTSSSISIANCFNNDAISVQDNITGSWAVSGSRVVQQKDAYKDTITVSAGSNVAKTYGSKSEKTGSWTQTSKSVKEYSTKTITTIKYTQTKTITYTKSFNVKIAYPKFEVSGYSQSGSNIGSARTAFMTCRKAMEFGNSLYNQMFLSSATASGYETRAWYCAKNDPSYWADLNYIEVGSNDTEIVGMLKIGSYLGFVKAGSGTDSSVYLAYPVRFDERDTFAVKQGVNGIGAVSNGAFNILNGEPLFLSDRGVIGIEVSDEETDRHARRRSWFIDKKLCAEKDLHTAVSYVFEGMYYLSVDGKCYVLDGSQKSSWANEKTNLQYECYYLENVPARCFASMNGKLYFVDNHGNICRFKDGEDVRPYTDDYSCEKEVVEFANFDIMTGNKKDIEKMKSYIGTQAHVSDTDKITESIGVIITHVDGELNEYTFTLMNPPKTGTTITVGYHLVVGTSIQVPKSYFTVGTPVEEVSVGNVIDKYYASYDGDATIRVWGDVPEGYGKLQIRKADYYLEDDTYYIKDVNEDAVEFEIIKGQPIPARWSTIADDDGAVHFFKNLRKKGCVLSLLPMPVTGATVLLKADEKEPVELGKVEFNGGTLPHEFYIKKKLKKYKRLQIICENNDLDGGFGIDQIIKSYTMGNYSKNRG